MGKEGNQRRCLASVFCFVEDQLWNSKMSLDLKGLKFVLHSRSLSEEDDKQPFENFAGKALGVSDVLALA